MTNNSAIRSGSRLPLRRSDIIRWVEDQVKSRLPTTSSVARPFHAGPKGVVHPAPYVARLHELISSVLQKDPSANVFLIEVAFTLAWQGHCGQLRKSGEAYINHPLSVAEIVSEWGLGPEEIAAALCHDLVEDVKDEKKKETMELIESKLGKRVAQLVDGTTELGKGPESTEIEPSTIDIYEKWLQYGSKDLASIVIKLADRLHNMRTLAHVGEKSARDKAEETLNVYARIANRLGMWVLKRELEDLSYVFLDTEHSSKIAGKRSKIVAQSIEIMRHEILPNLRAQLGESVDIIPETRSIYEIYERIRKRNISLEELSPTDIWRINIVVPGRRDCHVVEGMIHDELYSPVQDERRNFVGRNARPNGHQFLHSYVQVRDFGNLLIQIRDQEMQRNYRYGVVSKAQENKRWYKENFTWLNALIEDLKSEGVNEDTLYERIAAKTDPIVVFNKYQEAVELPFGSTVLDFASRFENPDIFVHAKEAVVFRKGVRRTLPLWEVLQPGDSVFIVIDKAVRPKLEWMDWIRTDIALESLQKYLRAHPNGSALGFLNERSMKFYLPAENLLRNKYFTSFIRRKGFLNSDDFLCKIGIGEVDVEELIEEFIAENRKMLSAQNKRLIGFRIEGEERLGLLDDITKKLRELGINLAAGDFYKIKEKGKEKAVIALIVESVTGRAGKVMQLQVSAIIEQTHGVQNFTTLNRQETAALHKTIKR